MDLLHLVTTKKSVLKIVSEIQTQCLVDFRGLESRKDENITYFSKEGTVESVLKDFLRHLGEKNYAFEYSDEKLLRISVFPESKAITAVNDTLNSEKPTPQETVGVVKVVDIIEGSQAESLGIMIDDIILEYNGLQIDSSNHIDGRRPSRPPLGWALKIHLAMIKAGFIDPQGPLFRVAVGLAGRGAGTDRDQPQLVLEIIADVHHGSINV